MKITKIKIENFKSIKEIEFEVKKYGGSHTTMLLGINESGKSNVLDAMSYFRRPESSVDYISLHNQKDEENNPVDLWFSLSVDNMENFVNKIKGEMIGVELLNFEVKNIVKNVYLQSDDKTFSEVFDFDFDKITENLFIKKIKKDIPKTNGAVESQDVFEVTNDGSDESGNTQSITADLLKDIFKTRIEEIIKENEPEVTFWTPSKEYLIDDEDLNKFVTNIDSRVALKNIFLLAGYNKEQIVEVIKNVPIGHQRSKLTSKLQEELNKYIKKVWKHNIDIVIDITETGRLTISVKDGGEENKHDRLPIGNRSEGARHFLSLILSLSIENKNQKRKNQLILIDEPENHLHPSGIRDLQKELLKIGENNCLFISTHSPFLVDKINKSRNVIIRKNALAHTEKLEIDENTDIIDDEVLREAFGIEVYKDLLNPHSILVEGSSDKKILQKALGTFEYKYGITNGHGSNIETLAAKLNDTGISLLVILDDDRSGKKYKENIIDIGGSFSKDNVFTIRDLVGEIKADGTIEDVLGKEFVESEFRRFYKSRFGQKCEIVLEDKKPYLEQMKAYLNKENKCENINKTIDSFKVKISEDFKPNGGLKENFPLLNSLVVEINKKLS